MAKRKRKAPDDNIFGLPNKVGRPRKARNPFALELKKRRGRPPKQKSLFEQKRSSRSSKPLKTEKSPKTASKRQKETFHPATTWSIYVVFVPATILSFIAVEYAPQSVSGTICLGSLIIYPFVLSARHRAHRMATLADVTMPLPDATYAPPVPALTGAEFEHEVAGLFNTLTKYNARVVGGAGDGGVDVEIYNGNQLVGIAQCKRYDPSKSLSPAPVRELYAVMHQKQVSVGYLFTTARVSEQTEHEARRLGVKLVYGARLMDMRHKARQTVQSYTV